MKSSTGGMGIGADAPVRLSLAASQLGSDLPLTEPGSTKRVPAVQRAAAILQTLAQNAVPLGLTRIARAVNILPSTALQILRELAAADLVAFDPVAKVYQLGPGLIVLAQAVARNDNFAEIARPHLQAISAQFDITSTATTMIDDQHTACVVSVSPPNAMSLNVTLGGRVPRLSGAAGRCIAAFSDENLDGMKAGFEQIRWQAPLDFDTWMRQVEEARGSGFGQDNGLFALGVTTLAAPVFDGNAKVTRSIGVATISAALTSLRKDEIAAALMVAAAAISKKLRL